MQCGPGTPLSSLRLRPTAGGISRAFASFRATRP